MSSESIAVPNDLVAAVLSAGVWLGIVPREAVVAWADYLIERTDQPPMWMIDLALSQNLHVVDLVGILDPIAKTADPTETCEEVYGFVELNPGPTYEEAERCIHQLYVIARHCLRDDWRNRLLSHADGLDDEFEMMRHGGFAAAKPTLIEEVRSFLERHQTFRVKSFLQSCRVKRDQPTASERP
jgi:hypothetical protein